MSGSMKDALEKSGTVNTPEPQQKPDPAKWRDELPEHEEKPHVPFEAPARLKPKPSKP
jgi:hypothetical protein